MKISKDSIFRYFWKVVISLVFWWKISAQHWPILIPRPDLERILNSLKMFKWSKQDLRTIKWSTDTRSRPKVKNHRPKSNVRFVENQISRSLWPYMVFWEAKGSFKHVHAKNSRKKNCFSFSDQINSNFNFCWPCLTTMMGANFFSEKVPDFIAFSYS